MTHDYPFKATGLIINDEEDVVKKSKPKFPDGKKISPECKDLILKMLEKDPNKRIKIDQILEHPWVKNIQFSFSHSHDVKLSENFASEAL